MSAIRIPAPLIDTNYELVKNWDFGHNIRDLSELRSEFHTRYGGGLGATDHLNDEWERYRDNDNHCFTAAGLSLVARCPTGVLADGKIESGMIRSKQSFERGYIEGRFRMPKGRGMWPAFWFIPANLKWPPEVDIFEIVNNGRDTTRNSFHNVRNPDAERVGANPALSADPTASPLALLKERDTLVLTSSVDQWSSYRPGLDYSEGFNTFGLLWEQYTAEWFVNGISVLKKQLDWRNKDGRGAGPAQIIANLAVGGAWPEPPQLLTDFPASLDIDYIRVWQLPR